MRVVATILFVISVAMAFKLQPRDYLAPEREESKSLSDEEDNGAGLYDDEDENEPGLSEEEEGNETGLSDKTQDEKVTTMYINKQLHFIFCFSVFSFLFEVVRDASELAFTSFCNASLETS